MIPLISVLLHKGHYNFYDSVNQISYDHLRQIIIYTKLSIESYNYTDPTTEDEKKFKEYPEIPNGYTRNLKIFNSSTGFVPKRQYFSLLKNGPVNQNPDKNIYKINEVDFESFIIDRDEKTNISNQQRYNTINSSAFQIGLEQNGTLGGHVVTLKPIKKDQYLLIDPNFFMGNKISNYSDYELKIVPSPNGIMMRFTFSMELLKSMFFSLYGRSQNAANFSIAEYLCWLNFINIDDNKEIKSKPIRTSSIISSYKSEYSKQSCEKCSKIQTKFNCRDMTKQWYINKPNLETYIQLYDDANINRFYTLGYNERIGLQKENVYGWCKIDYWEHKLINYEKEAPIILICIDPNKQYLYLGDHLWYEKNSQKYVFLTISIDKVHDSKTLICFDNTHELTLKSTDDNYSGFFELNDDFDTIIEKFIEWGYFLSEPDIIVIKRYLTDLKNNNINDPLEIPLETQDEDINTEDSSESVLGARLFGSCSHIIAKFNSFVLKYFREIIVSFVILIFIIILIIVLIRKRNNGIHEDN